jgi:hypothetical protein
MHRSYAGFSIFCLKKGELFTPSFVNNSDPLFYIRNILNATDGNSILFAYRDNNIIAF